MLEHEKQIYEYEKTLKDLKQQNQSSALLSDDEIQRLEKKLEELKTQVYTNLSAWDRIAICRHPQRPKAIDYIKNLCESFEEIFGDRLYRDDHAIITGFGIIGGEKFVIIAQEKGCDTESRLFRNFGMTYPEGYRKAMRVMNLAAKFGLPVLTIIDTPGAYPGLEAEERGQGWAIAHNLWAMSRLPTPIISLLIGEGCSGGALGIGVCDTLIMLEHAYYSVISPEGCASILWKDSTYTARAAEVLKLHAENLSEFNIVDEIIKEPLGGAHHNPEAVYSAAKSSILQWKKTLEAFTEETLIENRYNKYRKLGSFDVQQEPAATV